MHETIWTCDHCGERMKRPHNIDASGFTDGPDLTVGISSGTTRVSVDLCQPCFDRVRDVILPINSTRRALLDEEFKKHPRTKQAKLTIGTLKVYNPAS